MAETCSVCSIYINLFARNWWISMYSPFSARLYKLILSM